MDNLSSNKPPAARYDIEAAGAKMLFRPPYSLNFSPIEQVILEAQGTPAKATERPIHGLSDAIRCILHLHSPQEYANYFANAGCHAD